MDKQTNYLTIAIRTLRTSSESGPDFADAAEDELTALRARIAELEAELQFFRSSFPKAAKACGDARVKALQAARAAVGG